MGVLATVGMENHILTTPPYFIYTNSSPCAASFYSSFPIFIHPSPYPIVKRYETGRRFLWIQSSPHEGLQAGQHFRRVYTLHACSENDASQVISLLFGRLEMFIEKY